MRRLTTLALVASTGLFTLAIGCSGSTSATPDTSSGADGGSNASGSGDGTDGGAGPTCTPKAMAPLDGDHKGETLVDLAANEAGAWLLLRNGTDNAHSVVDPEGKVHALESDGVASAALSARSDGKVCAAWGVHTTASNAVHYACSPAFAVEDKKSTSRSIAPGCASASSSSTEMKGRCPPRFSLLRARR